MLQSVPGLLLFVMIVLTLVLLPYLNDDRPRSRERPSRADELHVKRHTGSIKSDHPGVKRDA
jgi:hypothetical protein